MKAIHTHSKMLDIAAELGPYPLLPDRAYYYPASTKNLPPAPKSCLPPHHHHICFFAVPALLQPHSNRGPWTRPVDLDTGSTLSNPQPLPALVSMLTYNAKSPNFESDITEFYKK